MTNTTQPNILIFMTDQQRGDSVNNPDYIMPNLNKFAQEGISFSQTYCSAPHCCPSRASFFSGEYPSKHGVWNNVHTRTALSRGLNHGITLWSEHLKESGYNLFFSGKWHVDYTKDPNSFGWNELKVISKANSSEMWTKWERYKQDDICQVGDEKQSAEIPRVGYPKYIQYFTNEDPFGDAQVVQEALEKLHDLKDAPKEQPWCMYIGTLGPHDVYQPPQRFLDMYQDMDIQLPINGNDNMLDKPGFYRKEQKLFNKLTPQEKIEAIRHYRAFCSYEDYLFGKVLAELDKNNQRENTLIIFLSDHGDYNGEHGLWTKGLPAFKGGYHIPLVMQWDNYMNHKGLIVDNFVSITDLFNTILEASTNKTISTKESISLLPYLKQKSPLRIRQEIYTQTNGNEIYGMQRSVTTKDYKFVFNTFDEDELYNLRIDKHEMKNVINDEKYHDVVHEMYIKMWQFAHKHDDNLINPYIMVGIATYGPGEIFNHKNKPKK